MCTPTSHSPLSSWRTESASSKSLASLGSMVQVYTSLKSSRSAMSASVISAGILLAASSTFFGYLYGSPYCASMAFISTLLSPCSPSTSTTSPTRFLCSASGHCVIFTTALSPDFPPLSFFLGMMMSCTKMFSEVINTAKSLSTRSLPTNVSRALLRIAVTIASLICFCRRAM